jgi:hypothetical protein
MVMGFDAGSCSDYDIERVVIHKTSDGKMKVRPVNEHPEITLDFINEAKFHAQSFQTLLASELEQKLEGNDLEIPDGESFF